MNCSIAQALEIVGEWWTLLIVRDAFLGYSRFDEFEARTGIARNVLADRLDTLVSHGVLKRVPYQEGPVRFDYKLTDKGRDLWPAMAALRQWGDKWSAPEGPPVELVHRECGERVSVVPTCSNCGKELDARAVTPVAGPGAHTKGRRPVPGARGGAAAFTDSSRS